jgi:uncharacterized protein YicC (UPF0701 family)
MVKSMTGFGRAEESVGDKTFLVDVKSLNGKQFELRFKLPGFLKPYESTFKIFLKNSAGVHSVMVNAKQTGNAKHKHQYRSCESLLKPS